MKRYGSICCVVVLAVAASICCVSGAIAEQEQVQQENKAVKFLKDLVKWPFSITKQAVGTVGRTAEQGLTQLQIQELAWLRLLPVSLKR